MGGGSAYRGLRRRIASWLLGALACSLPLAPAAATERVVSMNLCTDQLAMLLAEPDQLISVSHIAQDPNASAMAEEAKHYPANMGQAEEIFLLRPDLVLAGSYTTRATVSLLRQLGIDVIEFAPVTSIEQIHTRLEEMGRALHREEAARALSERFAADLDRLPPAGDTRPRAALIFANSYTAGAGTLPNSVLEAAGLDNVALELGLGAGGRLPLERLILTAPELIVTGQPHTGAARAEEVFTHPVLDVLLDQAGNAPVAGRDWTCGTPFVIRAIRRLAEARDSLGSEN